MEVASTGDLTCCVISNHPLAENKPVAWTPSPQKVSDDILVIRNALPRTAELVYYAEQFAGKFEQATVVKSDLSYAADDNHRRTDRISLSDENSPNALLFFGLMCRSTEGQFLKYYMDNVNSHAIVGVSSGYDLLRYRPGGFFREHVDVTRDHPILGHRRLSAVVFCNDDFVGGELVFPRQKLTIKPEAGMLVLFPSNFTHPHESTTIVSGTKYSIVSWYF